jgi:hypothetical protein
MAGGKAAALIVVLTIVTIVACGGGSSQTSSKPSASPSPVTSASASASPFAGSSASPIAGLCASQLPAGSPPLIAVLEAKGSSTSATGLPAFDSHDQLVIAGLDAVARARSAIANRSRPYVGGATPVLSPHEAYVVHGTVYFIDGFGTIFTIGSDNIQKTPATFPIGLDQQEVSFAVSPDGCQLVASILTIPSKGPGPVSGRWELSTMKAQVGGPTQLLHTWSTPQPPDSPGADPNFKNLVMVGWDAVGPIVVVGSSVGAQNIPYRVINPDFLGGSLAHLAADGTPGPAIALPGCMAIQVSGAGTITCYGNDGHNDTVSVLDSSGAQLLSPFPLTGLTEVAVGPNHLIALSGQWRGPVGVGTLPANFHPEGWVDQSTIFGRLSDSNGIGDAALAHLSGTQATIEDLKFKGDFVGPLS